MNKIINTKLIKILILEIWLAYIKIFVEKDENNYNECYSKYNISHYNVSDFNYILFHLYGILTIGLSIIGIVTSFKTFPFLWNIFHLIWISLIFVIVKAVRDGWKNFSSEIIDKDENQ